MNKDSPLFVDFTQENTLLSVLPCKPVASSRSAGWSSIHLAHYRLPPHCLPEHYSPHHSLCLNVGGAALLEQSIDGHFAVTHSVPGSLSLYPANLRQSVSWDREVDILLLDFEPTLLALGNDRPNLPPKLTFFDPLIQQIALALKSALENGLGSRLYEESMANALAVHLLSRYSTRTPAIWQPRGGLSQPDLMQVVDYIHAHLEQNLSLAELAAVVQLSPWHFARLFKQSTGVSPHQYHIRCRIERAKQLLLSRLAIADVAQVVGFASQGHFNYHFKRLVGTTPKKFLRQ